MSIKRISNDQCIAYRANFSTNLLTIEKTFKGNIKSAQNLYDAIPSDLKSKHGKTIRKQYLFDLMSAFEVLFVDSLFELLMSYPSKIRTESLSMDHIAESNSINQIIRSLVEKAIHNASYAKPIVFLIDAYQYFDEKITQDASVDVIIEAKATRDIYMHNNGLANSVYFQKTGQLKRVDSIGNVLNIDDTYLLGALDAVKKVGSSFVTKCHRKYAHNNTANAFKEMWEISSLNTVRKFEDHWDTVEGKIYNKNVSWGWSGSEKMLFNFFQLIHGGRSSCKDTNIIEIPDALSRWKGFPDEKLISSWLDSPFYL